jgi:hypothetical protein
MEIRAQSVNKKGSIRCHPCPAEPEAIGVGA